MLTTKAELNRHLIGVLLQFTKMDLELKILTKV